MNATTTNIGSWRNYKPPPITRGKMQGLEVLLLICLLYANASRLSMGVGSFIGQFYNNMTVFTD